jgi:muconolactone delta-isomerase
MEYLVEFNTAILDDAPPAEVEQRLAGETTRVAELAAQGHALRVWKPLPEDGRRRAVGLYRAGVDPVSWTLERFVPSPSRPAAGQTTPPGRRGSRQLCGCPMPDRRK